MQNSLAVITPNEWDTLQEQAVALVASGFLPQSVNTPQKAVAIMMLGRELGIPPWAALSTINVIQGKPTVSPQLMLALINRSGQLADMECLSSAAECTVTMVRRGRVPHTETFTIKDAAALQLTGKDNYKKQPATMLKWRAVAACARVVFPDVILGLYTHEEMGAEVVVDSEGNQMFVEPVQPSTPILVERVDAVGQNAPAPVPVRESALPASAAPNVSSSSASTPASPPTADASSDEPLFPPMVEGAVITPLNGDKPEHPQIGTINMKALYDRAGKATYVQVRAHFDNLIRELQAKGDVRDAMNIEQAWAAIQKHYADKAVTA